MEASTRNTDFYLEERLEGKKQKIALSRKESSELLRPETFQSLGLGVGFFPLGKGSKMHNL
jgi:hypothetical protein